MKIESSNPVPISTDPAKSAATRTFAAARAAATIKPAAAVDHAGKNSAPPGLERALARLQSVPESERTGGQSSAIEKISRNLARYTETAALAALPADTAVGGTLPDTVVA